MRLHFILFPLMAQGHMIPMVDVAQILARRGATVTIFTTPLNANRYKPVIARAVEAKLQIQMIGLPFPAAEAGLPQGCENFDMIPSVDLGMNVFVAASMLQEPVEVVLKELKPEPSCIISDMYLPWTADVARKFGIPRLIFNGTGCFSLLSLHNLTQSRIMDGIACDSKSFVIPGLPDRVETTKAKLSSMIDADTDAMNDYFGKIREAEKEAFGVVVNSFLDLEPNYAEKYTKTLAANGKKVWCVGPVSLRNKNSQDKIERGNKTVIDEHHFMEWLDTWEPTTVIYVCMGSLVRLSTPQLIEIGLALESSTRPFIWIIRHEPDEFKTWLFNESFEQRVKQRGILVHGWAPQVLILSHKAIGGFLTHCGWNSILEAISVGLPMLTWPHFAEQFLNESFVVEVVKIGVRIGVEAPVYIGYEERMGKLVKKDEILKGLEWLMDDGMEGKERRVRVRELGEMAKKAMEEDEGSSQVGVTQLLEDIMEATNRKSHK